MAQLKLAEQIIAEKDHDLKAVSYRADMAMLEKTTLEEELATIKTSSFSFHDTPESTPSRVSGCSHSCKSHVHRAARECPSCLYSCLVVSQLSNCFAAK